MMVNLQAVVLLTLLGHAFAVKDYLYKTCGQAGFCNRNRHFAEEIAKQGPKYESRYSVDVGSLQIDDSQGTASATLLKQLNNGKYVDLSLELSVLEDDNLRLRVDEMDREAHVGDNVTNVTKRRYNETAKWALHSEPVAAKFSHSLHSDKLAVKYGQDGSYEAIVDLYPFKVTLLHNGKPELVVNERQLFNFEHYRTKAEEEQEESNALAPEESSFGAYQDTFKDCKKDTLKLGPESVGVDFSFVGYKSVFGIPEHASRLSLQDTSDGEPYRLYNVDIFEYPVDSQSYPMYGSIPFMVGVKPGSAAGIFWMNAADTYIDIKKVVPGADNDERSILRRKTSPPEVQTHWFSENGIIDVVLMAKKTPLEISESYGRLTGFTTLPNLFSIGHHQSRWNYNDEEDVLEVAKRFDQSMIPCDAIWLDIEYTDSKKYFTWDPENFPHPGDMEAKLNETGKNLIVIVDPHIKTGYKVSDEAIKKKITIKNESGKDEYRGHSWPGESVWIDTLDPNCQPFWDELFANGTDLLGDSTNVHLWNDMNEPSVFNGPETSAPKDLIHYGNWEHRSVHNLYGLTFHEATYDALVARNENQRPFILTRSFFPGSQRTSAMWTGDNQAKWEHLQASIYMVLNMNLAGFPFSGADVGGFFQNPDSELLVRWYQTGIWYPFFRAHSHEDSRRREPFLIDEPYQSQIRDAIRLRYKLLPLMYSEFYKASKVGSPIIKALLYETPENERSYNIDDEFFFGNFLVKPVAQQGQNTTEIYLPDSEHTYYDFFDFSKSYHGEGYVDGIAAALDHIPVLLRDGSITPTKERYRRSSKLMKNDPYTLYVVLGKDGSAKGELYIDDGETFGYRNNDDFVYLSLQADREKISSSVAAGNTDKPFTSTLDKVTVERIELVGAQLAKDQRTVQVSQNGKQWTAEVEPVESSNHYILRNPAVSVGADWTITLL